MAKSEKLKKLDAEETKGVSGGIDIYYANVNGKGHYFTVNLKTKKVVDRSSVMRACAVVGPSAELIKCRSVEEARRRAQQELDVALNGAAGEASYPFAFEDDQYTINTFITGSLPDSWV